MLALGNFCTNFWASVKIVYISFSIFLFFMLWARAFCVSVCLWLRLHLRTYPLFTLEPYENNANGRSVGGVRMKKEPISSDFIHSNLKACKIDLFGYKFDWFCVFLAILANQNKEYRQNSLACCLFRPIW